MKNVFLGLAIVAGFSLPLAAQQMGSANRNAQKVSTAVEFADGSSIRVSYKALNFAEGKFMEQLKNERFRTMLNENAKQNPCGSVAVSHDMTFSSGFQIPAGEYGLHFMLNDKGMWMAALSSTNDEGDVEIKNFPLRLKEVENHRQRLSINLNAGDEVGQCTLAMQFGNMALEVTGGRVAEKKGGEDKDG
ncbi:MAG: hypothetical protein AB7I19_08350 [Planctomycetota bacterium]